NRVKLYKCQECETTTTRNRMIDLADIPWETSSHYEYSIQTDYSKQRQIKEQAYRMMDKLEGWCSRTKAMVLMDIIFNHRPKVVVEVGVYGGKSLIPVAYALKSLGEGIVYGIDPWKITDSVVGFDGANYDWWGMLDHEMIYRGFIKKVCEFQLGQYVKVIRSTSVEAAPIYDIDLIHIDGNHSEDSAYFDVQKWVPLVRDGGIIIFDDVDWATTRKAVDWLDEHCYRVTTFQGDNVWGLWIKI
ncbi:MAG: hypothetical protein K1000chlam3_01618, partial [Chlamydiae bacterium]|nr:hypothetical protein [Chlamydiota bacterium]